MRTLLEFLRLTRASGRLWWRYLPRLGAWFCVGYGVHLLAGYFSTLLGPINKLAATLVFVAGVVAWVATLVLMIQSLAASVPSPAPGAAASPRAPSKPLDAVVQSVGPFMAVYALWGLAEAQVRELFEQNLAQHGVDATSYSINLSQWPFYAAVAAGAWLARLALRRLVDRRGGRALAVGLVLADGTFIFSSFVALRALGQAVTTWVKTRVLWQWLLGAREALLAWIPDWRMFGQSLPEAVRTFTATLWTDLAPGFANAVLLPLLWLALTATVLGQHFSAGELFAGTRAAPLAERIGRQTRRIRESRFVAAGRWGRVASWATADLREKYLPVAHALRLLTGAGPRFVGAYLVLVALLGLVERLVSRAIQLLIGPQRLPVTLAYLPALGLATGLVFTTGAVAVYVAAFRRGLRFAFDSARSHPTGATAAEATKPGHEARLGAQPDAGAEVGEAELDEVIPGSGRRHDPEELRRLGRGDA